MPGRPPETSNAEYLRVIAEDAAPIVFTSEVADRLDVTQQGAFKRLAALRDRGLVDSKTGNETAWWLTDAGREDLAAAE